MRITATAALRGQVERPLRFDELSRGRLGVADFDGDGDDELWCSIPSEHPGLERFRICGIGTAPPLGGTSSSRSRTVSVARDLSVVAAAYARLLLKVVLLSKTIYSYEGPMMVASRTC